MAVISRLRLDFIPTVACIDRSTAPLGVDLDQMIAALQRYVDEHVARVWGTPARLVAEAEAPADAWELVFVDDGGVPGMCAAHVVHEGRPRSTVYVTGCRRRGVPVSRSASHELAEMLVDPGLNLLARHHATNAMYRYKVADPVDDEFFEIDGLPMSDFVYPAYFESFHRPGARTFDHLGRVTRPFQIRRGGHQSVHDDGTWSVTHRPVSKKARPTRPGTPVARRRRAALAEASVPALETSAGRPAPRLGPRPVTSWPLELDHIPTIACIDRTSARLGAELAELVAALQIYVDEHVAPVWGTPARLVEASRYLKDAWAIDFFDDPDQPICGKHHVTPEGLPIAKVYVGTCAKNAFPVSLSASHELAEMLVDPGINLMARREGSHKLYPCEVGDPVEDSSFLIRGLEMSNFVYPAYFESFRARGSVQFDHLRTVEAPFEVEVGGYQHEFEGGGWTVVHGSPDKEERYGKQDRRGRRGSQRKRLFEPTKSKETIMPKAAASKQKTGKAKAAPKKAPARAAATKASPKRKAAPAKAKAGKATAGKAKAGKATAGKATAGKAKAGKATASKAGGTPIAATGTQPGPMRRAGSASGPARPIASHTARRGAASDAGASQQKRGNSAAQEPDFASGGGRGKRTGAAADAGASQQKRGNSRAVQAPDFAAAGGAASRTSGGKGSRAAAPPTDPDGGDEHE